MENIIYHKIQKSFQNQKYYGVVAGLMKNWMLLRNM